MSVLLFWQAAGADTALNGSASITFTGPAAVLTTAIPLAGSSGIVFTGPAANLTTAIRFTGTAAVVFAGPSASLTTAIRLAGSSAVVFGGPAAVLTTAITLSGASAVVFTGPSALLDTLIALGGTSAVVFVGGAAVLGPAASAALVGSGSIVFIGGSAVLTTGSSKRFAILDAAANAPVVAQSLMDDLKERYGPERGRFIYFAMEREGKGPFAPDNKYDTAERPPQPIIIKRSVVPVGPAPRPVPRRSEGDLRAFTDAATRAMTRRRHQ